MIADKPGIDDAMPGLFNKAKSIIKGFAYRASPRKALYKTPELAQLVNHSTIGRVIQCRDTLLLVVLRKS